MKKIVIEFIHSKSNRYERQQDDTQDSSRSYTLQITTVPAENFLG